MYVRIASFVKNFYSMNTQTQPKIQFYFPTHLFFSSSLFFSSVVFTQHTYSDRERHRIRLYTLEDDPERKFTQFFKYYISMPAFACVRF